MRHATGVVDQKNRVCWPDLQGTLKHWPCSDVSYACEHQSRPGEGRQVPFGGRSMCNVLTFVLLAGNIERIQAQAAICSRLLAR